MNEEQEVNLSEQVWDGIDLFPDDETPQEPAQVDPNAERFERLESMIMGIAQNQQWQPAPQPEFDGDEYKKSIVDEIFRGLAPIITPLAMDRRTSEIARTHGIPEKLVNETLSTFDPSTAVQLAQNDQFWKQQAALSKPRASFSPSSGYGGTGAAPSPADSAIATFVAKSGLTGEAAQAKISEMRKALKAGSN